MSKAARHAGVALLLAALTVLHTWPLAARASTHMQPGQDPRAMIAGLYDLSRNLITQPDRLMDGSMFYPFRNTLAILDHQLGNAILGAPLVAGGASVVVVFNVVVLLTFLLSGFFMYLLVRRLTGSAAAGLVAGCAFAFSTSRTYNLPHAHLLATQWIPLALLAFHRYLERASFTRWLALTASALLVAASSWQIGILGGLSMAIVGLFTMVGDRRFFLRRALALGAAAAICALALAPLAAIYGSLGSYWPPDPGGDGREPLAEIVSLSVDVMGLAALPVESRAPYARLLARPGPSLFPGAVTLLLCLPALATLRGHGLGNTRASAVLRPALRVAIGFAAVVTLAAALHEPFENLAILTRPLAPYVVLGVVLAVCGLVFARRVGSFDSRRALIATYAALATAGTLFALGPRVIVNRVDVGSGIWRLDLLPIQLLMRAPVRFSVLVSVGLAVLAGIGAWILMQNVPRRLRAVTLVAILALLNLDLAFALPELATVRPPTGADRWLAESPDPGAVLEYPVLGNYWGVYSSQQYTKRPNVDGQGYLRPPEIVRVRAQPDFSERQLELLWEHFHPRFLVVRANEYRPRDRDAAFAAIAARGPALRLRAQDGDDYVYELFDRGSGPRLYRRWPDHVLRASGGRLRIVGRLTEGRADTVDELVVLLNGQVLRELRGATASARDFEVAFDPALILPGINTFEIRAGYRLADDAAARPVGATGGLLRADVEAVAGRDRAQIEINGRPLTPGPGYSLAAIDADTGQLTGFATFATGTSPTASAELVAFVARLPEGTAVAVATEGAAASQLTDGAVAALRELGLAVDLRERATAVHAAVGVKGAPAGSALEHADPETAAVVLGYPERRRFNLQRLELD